MISLVPSQRSRHFPVTPTALQQERLSWWLLKHWKTLEASSLILHLPLLKAVMSWKIEVILTFLIFGLLLHQSGQNRKEVDKKRKHRLGHNKNGNRRLVWEHWPWWRRLGGRGRRWSSFYKSWKVVNLMFEESCGSFILIKNGRFQKHRHDVDV